MAKSRRANSVAFGFDFQVNAAIVLMLEHIDELESLKLEGDYEDIELHFPDNECILAQAKAVEKGSTDFRNVREKLKKALKTLSEGASKIEARQLILITNSYNPLNEEASRILFNGEAYRDFSSLPDSSQAIISEYLKAISKPLNVKKFMIQVLPFETDNENERYKFVRQKVDDFIGELKLNISGITKEVLTTWHEDVFQNSTEKNADIVLDKKSIIWPLVIKVTDIERCNEEFLDRFDESLYNEIVYQYKDAINSCCEKYDFFIKVLYDYNLFQSTKSNKEKCVDFALTQWNNYLEDLRLTNVEAEVQEGFIIIVLYNIVSHRIAIDRIKQGVNL